MSQTALLIIDMQVAMFAYEGMSPYRGDEVLANCKQLLEKAREVHLPVVFVQHTADEEFTKGLSTWEICPEIAPLANEPIVEKASWDSFYQTTLHQTLQDLGVNHLIIMGMQSEFCLDTTCRRAFSMGYQNVLVQDAHSTFDSNFLTGEQIVQHHTQVLGGRFAQLQNTHEVLEQLLSL
ncbi:MAG: cysteine hydrolase [Gorillibacterium sp.]|nr:cysteine hydrolase [Gorillibacterium sp.]